MTLSGSEATPKMRRCLICERVLINVEYEKEFVRSICKTHMRCCEKVYFTCSGIPKRRLR